VITPLASAALRPFGAVVFPGCDERRLGAWSPSPTLLPEPLAREFGVMDSQLARNHELLAFAQILRAPHLTLLRRCFDDDEALAPSPLVERAWLARRRLSRPLPEEYPFVPTLAQTPLCPLARPAPSMSDAMPARLSASSVEALRDCPYRFYARVALGLGEANELDAGLDQSDRGRWLHAVLHRFHNQRDGSGDRMQLQAAAEAEQRSLELDPAAMLPMRAAFDLFAARYLDWLQAHEAEGWRYAGGELDRRCAAPELDGLVLDGRLDRIDHGADGGVMLIDYKTGNSDALARRVRTPLEDTQLAFYAALLTDEPHEPPPRAIYLALDERKAPQPIEHPDVARSASLLVQGLAADLDALRLGTGAPALGEGAACEHCHARGLCRRDHWAPPEAAAPLPPEGGDASGPAKPDPRRLLGGIV
jgi:ATP-dependent helicase/nuclease subunit B